MPGTTESHAVQNIGAKWTAWGSMTVWTILDNQVVSDSKVALAVWGLLVIWPAEKAVLNRQYSI